MEVQEREYRKKSYQNNNVRILPKTGGHEFLGWPVQQSEWKIIIQGILR